jgi:uncharacterized protein (DUF433 family)
MTKLEAMQDTPLRLDEDGTIRISGSRVSLEAVVRQFKLGATAEQIQQDFPSLTLREIHEAIYYYLNHTEAVEEYLQQQEAAAEETRRFIDGHHHTGTLRERIRARRQQKVNK